jgi:hypothetical protein
LILGLRGILAALDDAETEREIVEIVRDSFAQLTVTDITSLPEDCRPGRIRDHHDIAEYALRLGRRRLVEDTLSDPALLYDMYEILQRASTRIGRLPRSPASHASETGDPGAPFARS